MFCEPKRHLYKVLIVNLKERKDILAQFTLHTVNFSDISSTPQQAAAGITRGLS